jgi:hypothetical protein
MVASRNIEERWGSTLRLLLYKEAPHEYIITMVRLNPLNDYLIVKMFRETGDEEQLLSLMNAEGSKTEKRFTSLQILENKTLTTEVIGDKKIILQSIADGTNLTTEEIASL